MIERVTVTLDGVEYAKEVLYLTDQQCNALSSGDGIQRCLDALNLGRPKCVLRFLAAEKGRAEFLVHTERHGQYFSAQRYGCNLHSGDATRAEENLTVFLTECVVPLFRGERALLICSGCNDDTLSAAVSDVLARLSKRESCSLSVLTFVWSFEVYSKACTPGSVAHQVREGCSAWNRRLGTLSKQMDAWAEHDKQQCDLIAAATHVIVFEALAKNDYQCGPAEIFKANITNALSNQLPTIAIQAGSCMYTDLADLCGGGVPVLLLDCRERKESAESPDSPDSSPRSSGALLPRYQTKLAKRCAKAAPPAAGESPTLQLTRAIKVIESVINVLGSEQPPVVDYDKTSWLAYIHSELRRLLPDDEDDRFLPLYARILREENEEGQETRGDSSGLVRYAARKLNESIPRVVAGMRLKQIDYWKKHYSSDAKAEILKAGTGRGSDYRFTLN
jgi:hypothetical protein